MKRALPYVIAAAALVALAVYIFTVTFPLPSDLAPIPEPRSAARALSTATPIIIAVDTPVPTRTRVPTINPTAGPSASASPSAGPTATAPRDVTFSVDSTPTAPDDSEHVWTAFDLLRNYFTNRDYELIPQTMPWTNSTLNVSELPKELGGVTYWDFFSEHENWDSPSYMWQDDSGNWRPYQKETVFDSTGKPLPAYELLTRIGPGAMDKLWFTEDAMWMLTTEQSRADVGPIADMNDFTEWGNLDKLGNLRIMVDGDIAYDGPVRDWISGKAWGLTPELAQALTWRHREFGSSGALLPVLYQQSLRVLLYGGTKKPKWFLATGVRLLYNETVQPYTGGPSSDLPLAQMNVLARNILQPEGYIDTLENVRSVRLAVPPNSSASLQFQGAGTLRALELRLPMSVDARALWLRVRYGDTLGINLPLVAFFGDQKQLVLHRSTPLGIVESGSDHVFYCNLPLPFQDGMTIELASSAPSPLTVAARLVVSSDAAPTQLRVAYDPGQKLAVYGPDYIVRLPGDGKLVGIVLETDEQDLAKIPKIFTKPDVEDLVRRAWSMGYLEGNLTMADGTGLTRTYGGQEDWADGGFYFNRGYTSPPGGSNRPFGGILRYKDGDDGYATLFRYFNDVSAFVYHNGLTLAFGHGTWNNNFPVRYGSTLYYYSTLVQ